MWWYAGLRQPEPAPSAVQLRWVINRKKNGPLYLSGAGQESSADVIKILSSPVKDTYHSSSVRLALSERENQPKQVGTVRSLLEETKDASCQPENLPGTHSAPRLAGRVLRPPGSWPLCKRESVAGTVRMAVVGTAAGCSCASDG